jgi:simple sugar transport system substrate-binding protein
VQTNTGLLFVTKDTVEAYQSTKNRYEGSDSAPKLISRSGKIAHA